MYSPEFIARLPNLNCVFLVYLVYLVFLVYLVYLVYQLLPPAAAGISQSM